MKSIFKFLAICLVLASCLCTVACSKSEDLRNESVGDVESGSQIVDPDINRKIVYDVRLYMRSDEVSKLKAQFLDQCAAMGGYVEYNDENYSDGRCTQVNVTFRVPTEKLDEFVRSIEGEGKIESKNVSLTDITTSYVNASAKKSALEERKQQLEQILDEDGISTSERISVINEISAVNTELMEIQLLIDSYDSMVDYSTVRVNISENVRFIDVFLPLFIVFVLPAIVFLAIFVPLRIARKKRASNFRF